MTSKTKTAMTPTRSENYAEWYQAVLKAADLAEHAPVKGCMVIKPWGYALWENMQAYLDRRLKERGVQNAYFPLFIPLSFLQKEADHIEGFAQECAVVTHHRLQKNKEGQLEAAGELEEPLIVRPTSEMIIGEMFSKWVTSYRDLPLLINQWANVVRWEMRTRLFLRTTEFLWQEGHTVHASEADARQMTLEMLDLYESFAQKVLAIPVIKGEKTPFERFPGAVATYTIEGMMQDRKALQMGTSHFLGQNFAKGSSIRFRDAGGDERYAWTTSWGVTTRLIGALVMTHSDDDGLVLPPRIAPAHVVLIPVVHREEKRGEVLREVHRLANELREAVYDGKNLQVIVDERELRGGEKSWSWIKKGVPLRVEIGPREIETGVFAISRRDAPPKETVQLSRGEMLLRLPALLEEIQQQLYLRAAQWRETSLRKIETREEFYAFFTPRSAETPEIHGGFAQAHWSGEVEVEKRLKEDLGVTIRCIPLTQEPEEGLCPFSGKKSLGRVIYAKAY